MVLVRSKLAYSPNEFISIVGHYLSLVLSASG